MAKSSFINYFMVFRMVFGLAKFDYAKKNTLLKLHCYFITYKVIK